MPWHCRWRYSLGGMVGTTNDRVDAKPQRAPGCRHVEPGGPVQRPSGSRDHARLRAPIALRLPPWAHASAPAGSPPGSCRALDKRWLSVIWLDADSRIVAKRTVGYREQAYGDTCAGHHAAPGSAFGDVRRPQTGKLIARYDQPT